MSFLQGNTYSLPIEISDCCGEPIGPDDVSRVQVVLGSIEKFYGEGGEITYDQEDKVFVVPLSEEETFAMNRILKWQVRVVYKDGRIDGTEPMSENVIGSITQTRLTEQEEIEDEEVGGGD